MLLVAREVLERFPDARFLHYGPVTSGQEATGDPATSSPASRPRGPFTFMGRTDDPHGVVREADIVLMTSISEGLPLAALEAMAQGRPVVSTAVGGVRTCSRGAGLLAPASDVHRLAAAVGLLLRDRRWRTGSASAATSVWPRAPPRTAAWAAIGTCSWSSSAGAA